MDRTTIFLDEADRTAIRLIRERWGVGSDSAAIRLAVRVLAEGETVTISAPRTTDRLPLAADDGSQKEL